MTSPTIGLLFMGFVFGILLGTTTFGMNRFDRSIGAMQLVSFVGTFAITITGFAFFMNVSLGDVDEYKNTSPPLIALALLIACFGGIACWWLLGKIFPIASKTH